MKELLHITGVRSDCSVQLGLIQLQLSSRRKLNADFRQVLISAAIRVGSQQNRPQVTEYSAQYRVAAQRTLCLFRGELAQLVVLANKRFEILLNRRVIIGYIVRDGASFQQRETDAWNGVLHDVGRALDVDSIHIQQRV